MLPEQGSKVKNGADKLSNTLKSQDNDLILLRDGTYLGYPNDPDFDGIGMVMKRSELMSLAGKILSLKDQNGSEDLILKLYSIAQGGDKSISPEERRLLRRKKLIRGEGLEAIYHVKCFLRTFCQDQQGKLDLVNLERLKELKNQPTEDWAYAITPCISRAKIKKEDRTRKTESEILGNFERLAKELRYTFKFWKYDEDTLASAEVALAASAAIHMNQLRDTGTQYIIHPFSAGKFIASFASALGIKLPPEIINTSFFHDIIEDHSETFEAKLDYFRSKTLHLENSSLSGWILDFLNPNRIRLFDLIAFPGKTKANIESLTKPETKGMPIDLKQKILFEYWTKKYASCSAEAQIVKAADTVHNFVTRGTTKLENYPEIILESLAFKIPGLKKIAAEHENSDYRLLAANLAVFLEGNCGQMMKEFIDRSHELLDGPAATGILTTEDIANFKREPAVSKIRLMGLLEGMATKSEDFRGSIISIKDIYESSRSIFEVFASCAIGIMRNKPSLAI